uniref:Uncharacterized protein n=1 Tax=Panagrolaimus superbus TaxID=310955 RepID=A0A914ZI37_9BILA
MRESGDGIACNVLENFRYGIINLFSDDVNWDDINEGEVLFLEKFPEVAYGGVGIYVIGDYATPIKEIMDAKKSRLAHYCATNDRVYDHKEFPLLQVDMSVPDDENVQCCCRQLYVGKSSAINFHRGPEHIKDAILQSACPSVTLKAGAIYTAAMNCRHIDKMHLNLNMPKYKAIITFTKLQLCLKHRSLQLLITKLRTKTVRHYLFHGLHGKQLDVVWTESNVPISSDPIYNLVDKKFTRSDLNIHSNEPSANIITRRIASWLKKFDYQTDSLAADIQLCLNYVFKLDTVSFC